MFELKHILVGVALYLVTLKAYCQIGAEAQGGQLTFWGAIGIDQGIGKRWVSVTDIGYGRHSDPNDVQIFKRQGLNVVTEDLIFKPNEHWRFAFSFGYWRRNAYQDVEPYNERMRPYEFRNEVRPFQRIYYLHAINRIQISHALRTDYRFYFNQNFTDRWTTPFEFRARYMQTWKFPMDKDAKNWLIVNDEVLTAIDKYSTEVPLAHVVPWSSYQITENRFSLYYRRRLAGNIDIDLGVMDQYWRERPGESTFHVSYNLMFDVIIRNPFGKRFITDKEEE